MPITCDRSSPCSVSPLSRLTELNYGRQGVADFVGDAGGHLAHAGEAFRLRALPVFP